MLAEPAYAAARAKARAARDLRRAAAFAEEQRFANELGETPDVLLDLENIFNDVLSRVGGRLTLLDATIDFDDRRRRLTHISLTTGAPGSDGTGLALVEALAGSIFTAGGRAYPRWRVRTPGMGPVGLRDALFGAGALAFTRTPTQRVYAAAKSEERLQQLAVGQPVDERGFGLFYHPGNLAAGPRVRSVCITVIDIDRAASIIERVPKAERRALMKKYNDDEKARREARRRGGGGGGGGDDDDVDDDDDL